MKIVVGVDLSGMFQPALHLCLNLGFADPQFLLVHSVEPIPEYAPPMREPVFETSEWMKHLRAAGQEAIKNAENGLPPGAPVRTLVVDGYAAANLIEIADAEAANLVVIGSSRPGRVAGFLIGSVARGLTIGSRQSLLITKRGELPGQADRALFATDGSPYSSSCLDLLLQFAPKGLTRIDVVRAYDLSDLAATIAELRLTHDAEQSKSLLLSQMQEDCEYMCDRLRKAGYVSHALLREGHPSAVLPRMMAEADAQVMIVGAQGHGFLERIFIGSTSLNQVTNEPYPVLVLRVPQRID